mmetsp:Transcript_35035/g.139099  ORF Transcript_35035/g.139099 Transcript_35035/m.139099 type:complete len:153 (-) Transcript_35035:288-746(-)
MAWNWNRIRLGAIRGENESAQPESAQSERGHRHVPAARDHFAAVFYSRHSIAVGTRSLYGPLVVSHISEEGKKKLFYRFFLGLSMVHGLGDPTFGYLSSARWKMLIAASTVWATKLLSSERFALASSAITLVMLSSSTSRDCFFISRRPRIS